jgi:hypothetical protein
VSPYCGTITGARYHSRDNTPVCPPCREIARRALADVRKRRYLAGGSLIGPTVGTARRLRALARIGWSFPALGQRLGVTKEAVKGWALADTEGKYLRLSTINRIAALYDELCMIPGPSKTAVNRATAKGWSPPLAWDEGQIDDPRAVSYTEIEGAHAEALLEEERRVKRVAKKASVDRLRTQDPVRYAEQQRKWAAAKRGYRSRDAAQVAA